RETTSAIRPECLEPGSPPNAGPLRSKYMASTNETIVLLFSFQNASKFLRYLPQFLFQNARPLPLFRRSGLRRFFRQSPKMRSFTGKSAHDAFTLLFSQLFEIIEFGSKLIGR